MASITYNNGSIYYNDKKLATTEDINNSLSKFADASANYNYYNTITTVNNYVTNSSGHIAEMISPQNWISSNEYNRNNFNLIINPITDLSTNSIYFFNGTFNILFDDVIIQDSSSRFITLITDKEITSDISLVNILYCYEPINTYEFFNNKNNYVIQINDKIITKYERNLYLYLQVISNITSTGIQIEQQANIEEGRFLTRSAFALLLIEPV
jgi:hypothetical protein